MKKKILLFKSYSDKDDVKAVEKVIKRGIWWVKGPEIEEFEEKVAGFVGRRYGISFNSGTTALYSILLAYGINNGQVIVPSYTFPATANAVLAAGAEPVFADIEEQSLALDYKDVAGRITAKTRAIMPIHFAGDICRDIHRLKKLARERDVYLFEDAAHSLGANLNGRNVGAFGDAAMFSFCFNKILTTGEGGMVVTDSKKLAERLKLIRSHGRNAKGDYVRYGFNFRMSSMTAALGLSQFKKLDYIISTRRKTANYLNKRLLDVPGVKVPVPEKGHDSVFQMYNIQLENRQTRGGLKKHLESKGIPTRITYTPVHLYSNYRKKLNYKEGDLPVTEKISGCILTLPFYVGLAYSDIDFIVRQIACFMKGKL